MKIYIMTMTKEDKLNKIESLKLKAIQLKKEAKRF